MTSYLEGGWFADSSRTRLRSAVVDGAMDVAGMLVRSGVPAHRVLRIALRIRTLVVVADPLMRGHSGFGPRDRAAITDQLAIYTDDYPELQSFLFDCVERVGGPREMTALYLHLVHIVRMMQLLGHALSPEVMRKLGLCAGASDTASAAKPARPGGRAVTAARPKRKPVARKAPAKKTPAARGRARKR